MSLVEISQSKEDQFKRLRIWAECNEKFLNSVGFSLSATPSRSSGFLAFAFSDEINPMLELTELSGEILSSYHNKSWVPIASLTQVDLFLRKSGKTQNLVELGYLLAQLLYSCTQVANSARRIDEIRKIAHFVEATYATIGVFDGFWYETPPIWKEYFLNVLHYLLEIPEDRQQRQFVFKAQESTMFMSQRRLDSLLDRIEKDKNAIIVKNTRIDEAGNPETPIPRLIILAEDSSYLVRKAVASNPSTPIEVLFRLSDDKAFNVRAGVVQNPKVPEGLLQKLWEVQNFIVRDAFASNAALHRFLPVGQRSFYDFG